MLIEHTLFGTVDKVQTAIDRLKAFEPKDRPYWLAFSGGKDSCVILELANMAGVNFEAHYNVTSVDPPEVIWFIRREYPEVIFSRQHYDDGKPITMWSLMKNRALPPTKIGRYCCNRLKEAGGQGTVTITGVRWAESVKRKINQGLVTVIGRDISDIDEAAQANWKQTKLGGFILNDDNDEARRAVEVCFRTHKTLVNPIIDWTDDEVWEFIHKYNVPYCELYDKGEKRIGCIGCPMGGFTTMKRDFEKYPKYKEQYLRCFDKMYQNRIDRGLPLNNWKCGKDIFDWLVGDLKQDEHDEITLFHEEEMEDT